MGDKKTTEKKLAEMAKSVKDLNARLTKAAEMVVDKLCASDDKVEALNRVVSNLSRRVAMLEEEKE